MAGTSEKESNERQEVMRASMSFTNPKEIEATIQVTMKMSEWQELQGQLVADYPSWKLGSVISELIFETNQTAHFTKE